MRKINLPNLILHFIMLNMHIICQVEHISKNHLKKLKLKDRYKSNFKDKLGKDDRLNVKPVSLHVDKDKVETHKPTSHNRLYDVPFHLRQGFESELMNMLEAWVITQCDKPTLWNTKAFPVQKNSDH